MLASEERIGSMRVIVPVNRYIRAAATIDEIEAEMNVDRRNRQKTVLKPRFVREICSVH